MPPWMYLPGTDAVHRQAAGVDVVPGRRRVRDHVAAGLLGQTRKHGPAVKLPGPAAAAFFFAMISFRGVFVCS
jgi:hypothetical protein